MFTERELLKQWNIYFAAITKECRIIHNNILLYVNWQKQIAKVYMHQDSMFLLCSGPAQVMPIFNYKICYYKL